MFRTAKAYADNHSNKFSSCPIDWTDSQLTGNTLPAQHCYIYGHIPISNLCYALRDTYSEAIYIHYIQLTGKTLAAGHVAWLLYRLTRPCIQYKKPDLDCFFCKIGVVWGCLVLWTEQLIFVCAKQHH